MSLSGEHCRAQQVADSFDLMGVSLTPRDHRVFVWGGKRGTIAQLTASVGGYTPHLRYNESDYDSDDPEDDDDACSAPTTTIALDWEVMAAHRATMTIDVEGRCFARALDAMQDWLKAKMPQLGRVVLCTAIVGRTTQDIERIYKAAAAGFTIRARAFDEDDDLRFWPRTGDIFHATKTTTLLATAPPTTKKKKKKKQKHSHDETDKQAKQAN